MKLLALIAGFVLSTGCGAANTSSPPKDSDESEIAPQALVSEQPEEPEKAPGEENSVVGSWENASCGERKYRRQISFVQDGKFAAVDEVAPCPPNVQCVWSGIVHWHGTWILKDRVVTLDSKPVRDSKKPEKLPKEFVIVDDDPLSIGERDGKLVCPYRKIR